MNKTQQKKMYYAFFAILALIMSLTQLDLVHFSPHIEKKIEKILGESKSNSYFLLCILLSLCLWTCVVLFYRQLIITLLSYTGWMYEARGKMSVRTKLWGVLVKIFINPKSKIFDYQSYLPYLPLPNLNDTVNRYLRSVRPLLSDQEYYKLEKQAVEFKKSIGWRFHLLLRLKWLVTPNYVSDWWESYAYLKSRSPIMAYSNIYGLEFINSVHTNVQSARAANVISIAIMFKQMIDKNSLVPITIQNSIPMCNNQYKRMFNTARVPGEQMDKIVHHQVKNGESLNHVAVFANGKWFKLNTHFNGEQLTPKELEL
jgi:carnitine O-palmitoyltransferase 1